MQHITSGLSLTIISCRNAVPPSINYTECFAGYSARLKVSFAPQLGYSLIGTRVRRQPGFKGISLASAPNIDKNCVLFDRFNSISFNPRCRMCCEIFRRRHYALTFRKLRGTGILGPRETASSRVQQSYVTRIAEFTLACASDILHGGEVERAWRSYQRRHVDSTRPAIESNGVVLMGYAG